MPASFGCTREDGARLRDALLFEDGIEVPVGVWNGCLWIRVSAQIYNALEDVERLAQALEARTAARVGRGVLP